MPNNRCVPGVLHFVLLLSLLVPVSATAGKVSCDIPLVEPNTETNLTCFFSQDASQMKNDITVYHYSNDIRPNSVLDCLWIIGKMRCLLQPGYEFDHVVTDHMTVRIPQASERHTGRYTCQVSGQRSEDIQSCYFDLQRDETVTCDIPAVEPTTGTNLTCHFPVDVSQSRRNFKVYRYTDSGERGKILDCSWRGQRLHCDVSHGFEFDKVVSDKITVRLPHASDDHLGNYTCQLLGTKSKYIQPCHFAFTQDETVTCEIPSVERETDTQLTCHFPEDVSRSQRNFMVYHHRDQTRHTVVECRWLDGATDCFIQPGYEHDKVVSNTITLRVPRVSDHHTGNYTCQLLGTRPGGVQPCRFTLQQESEGHVPGGGRLTAGVSWAVSGVVFLAVLIVK